MQLIDCYGIGYLLFVICHLSLVLSEAVGVVTERSRTPPGKQATRSVS
ncbi:hypothetical protein NSTC731_02111 [Nostoc sp. DSM 114167]